ncbi:hypothetical protein [Uliginosibacterium sp. TH139]|uniref:rolling circle replication-associated protein n=1 Tax=Uliginosibacterium sp. TH139 TaxID=2067453 RepID=UPI00117EC62B|nr:hypothetical protein [Uliginosibacterium sp. TH139]
MTNLAVAEHFVNDDESIPFELPERNYFMKIRTFQNGTLEGCVQAVRPMAMDAMKDRFESSGTHAPGFGAKPLTEEEEAEKRERNHKRAVRRAKQSARWLVKQISADRLLTLTYRENMQDRERLYDDFKRFVRLLRKELKGRPWPYVAVPELQDRGAFHIHLAVKGWQPYSVIRRCWYQALGGRGDEKGVETPGQVDVTSPRAKQGMGGAGRQWDSSRLSGYIVKYMEKTFDDLTDSEKKRYWHSADAKKPTVHRVWLGAVDVTEACPEAIGVLQTFYGLVGAQFDMWLSPDGTTFWVAGKNTVQIDVEHDGEEPPF